MVFSTMKDNQHTIFQTPIWGFMLNDQQYQSMDYRDYILEMAEKEPSAKKSNFGGWQSRDNIHETEGIFKEFTSSLNKIANGILCE
jgi:fumarate hydratase class II